MKKWWEFTVTGRNDFPVDMLRHDSCWPRTEGDSAEIAASFRRHTNGKQREVRLTSATDYPTDARWRSFGWAVTAQREVRV